MAKSAVYQVYTDADFCSCIVIDSDVKSVSFIAFPSDGELKVSTLPKKQFLEQYTHRPGHSVKVAANLYTAVPNVVISKEAGNHLRNASNVKELEMAEAKKKVTPAATEAAAAPKTTRGKAATPAATASKAAPAKTVANKAAPAKAAPTKGKAAPAEKVDSGEAKTPKSNYAGKKIKTLVKLADCGLRASSKRYAMLEFVSKAKTVDEVLGQEFEFNGETISIGAGNLRGMLERNHIEIY